jgi:hypothetical protein
MLQRFIVGVMCACCGVHRKKEVEPRPPMAVSVPTIPEDPTGSGGTGEAAGIAARHTGSGRPVPHVRTPTGADPPSTPDGVRYFNLGLFHWAVRRR